MTKEKDQRPDWASSWGRDAFGVYAEVELNGLGQRLRWIEPGRFVMGSPIDEPGRRDNEGEQREVCIEHGYWLFDTPVTQAFWQALMGGNPSHFVSPQRPVEQVSWDDCQDFVAQLGRCLPALQWSLPSEAQWEYACRAGTDTALYSGPIEILRRHHAPALDAIAWYGGNSGVDFELEDGWDTADWRQQHPRDRSGSHAVAGKQPNPWGLYDMLGNVWEWTADIWQDGYQDAPSDGSAWQGPTDRPLKAGRQRRVLRGGSWYDVASYVRAATRYGRGQAGGLDVFGLRCCGQPRD